jgi:hypothetical protein
MLCLSSLTFLLNTYEYSIRDHKKMRIEIFVAFIAKKGLMLLKIEICVVLLTVREKRHKTNVIL